MAHDEQNTQETQSLRSPGRDAECITPAVDIYETETGHILLADVPGVQRDGLDINIEQDRLTIRGRVRAAGEPGSQHDEFAVRDYYRVFTLADEIDTGKISANLTDGVLRLTLPKSVKARVRKIPVTAE